MKLVITISLVDVGGKYLDAPSYARSWPVVMFDWNKFIRLIEEVVSENTGNNERTDAK